MNRSSAQKTNKETLALNCTSYELNRDLQTFPYKEYTFFSSTYETFSKIYYILYYKRNINVISTYRVMVRIKKTDKGC